MHSTLPGAPTLPRVDEDLLDKARMAVVIDTNYFIDDLALIQALSRLAYPERLVIVLPSVVLQELDKLKTSYKISHGLGRKPEQIGLLVRGATRFLDYELGRSNSALRCQKVSEYVRQEKANDDKILDCCLYIIEQRKLPVAILTRDRNLAVKARANGCATCGDWANGAVGLLTAILTSGGLEVQTQLPAVAAPPSLQTHSTVAEQSSDESSSGCHNAKRPALVPKRAWKGKTHAAQPRRKAQRILKWTRTNAHPPLPGLTVFGRASSGFTFTAPSYISLSDLATPPPMSRYQPQAAIVISDSENDDMDIDMQDDDPEVQFIEAVAPSSGYTPVVSPVVQISPTPTTPAQRMPPPPAVSVTPLALAPPVDFLSPAINDQLPNPVVIYLDDSSESAKQAGRLHTVSKSAVEISKDITTYIYNTLSCGFTTLLVERLQRGLSTSYAGNWITTLSEMFDPPPWKSATVILTVLLYYWEPIFSLVFPRSFGASIRGVIPWVMKVECLTECPQTRRDLPQSLRFAPFVYSSAAFGSTLDKESMHDAERRTETAKLIHLAKRLLAQSALVESDAQEWRRLQLFDDWVAWQKVHG
ncbi:hypothetical protein GGI20_004279 [Coemansia sp. BCRC 34301]|nr:hypothetical protein GGI20_004279 [Coemansia sp. BCRC 34301]